MLIEVLEMPWEDDGPPPRHKCAHGNLISTCTGCCIHGHRLDITELQPCPGCLCPVTDEAHVWLLQETPNVCADCGAVKRV